MKYLVILIISLGFYGSLFAQNLEIIPELKPGDTVEKDVNEVGVGGHVWDEYNRQATEYQEDGNLAAQMASGIFTWDTLLDYLAYLIKFLSEIGIFVGACFIVYAGYLYATSIFNADSGATSKGNTAIKNAIIGVIVITFSYAIMKAITAAFLT
ncbi:hypothetical protein P148_SR1C00001G0839 [candidate division SR1 bacterium RAAC1_SR1_1]|nr:hypothetical protein P148_SR1C00001G0839 [candidate division SR1 bacterium RAAC1_SR1_1]